MTHKNEEPWEKLENKKAKGILRERQLDKEGSIRQERLDDIDRDADTNRSRILKEDIKKDHEAYDS